MNIKATREFMRGIAKSARKTLQDNYKQVYGDKWKERFNEDMKALEWKIK